MPHLFDKLPVRGATLRNRIAVSPMCQYSSVEGKATDWHLVHLGSRAVGGAGLVMVEATGVERRGRITHGCMGIWSEEHVEPLARIARFVKEHKAVAAIQLAHAGRKASQARTWEGGHFLSKEEGAWEIVGPSPIPFGENAPVPKPLSVEEIRSVQKAFGEAARRAKEAGFEWLEIHGGHGYLIHSFHSPLSNQRADAYGGSFENRIRFTVETVREVRAAWPDDRPLGIRLSCTDFMEGGWTLPETIELARTLKDEGVDLIDCSGGGGTPKAKIPAGPGYMVEFSREVRRAAGVLTGTVGMITQPWQADQIVRNGEADVVFIAREMLRDPYWPQRAAASLGHKEWAYVPDPYHRAH
ncbi:MAG: NADH:flavin oxidoreductase/NADH oxidase [Candidatus Tectomicrobia bacterium]|uniref:NADH:flavin oxidoreductase/NADH oxidase n=1 Tax=Tectimicrobiota bacterium TaxID=2528274 RepID=A0A932I0N8_UNCTE|nr:NADH:flavin oxidoreductase/NADH oxidase [Candidatus Tectomicrobia bacterium]